MILARAYYVVGRIDKCLEFLSTDFAPQPLPPGYNFVLIIQGLTIRGLFFFFPYRRKRGKERELFNTYHYLLVFRNGTGITWWWEWCSHLLWSGCCIVISVLRWKIWTIIGLVRRSFISSVSIESKNRVKINIIIYYYFFNLFFA